MRKHTSGPWKVDIWDYNKAIAPRKDLVIIGPSYRVAVLDWDEGQENPYTIPNEEAQANARLIAAAPELLEAAKAVLKEWGSIPGTEAGKEQRNAGMMLDAAIAKAEGREK